MIYVLWMHSILWIILRYDLLRVYELSSMYMKMRIKVWFDDGLWVSKYVYEIQKWDMFYEFNDEFKISCYSLQMMWRVHDVKWYMGM